MTLLMNPRTLIACADEPADVVDGLLGDIADLKREVGQLREALASRAVIDQAKGMVMVGYGLDADAAFAVLARWSQDLNVKLRLLAQAMVTASGTHEGLRHGLRPG